MKFDPDKQPVIETDASDYVIGVELCLSIRSPAPLLIFPRNTLLLNASMRSMTKNSWLIFVVLRSWRAELEGSAVPLYTCLAITKTWRVFYDD